MSAFTQIISSEQLLTRLHHPDWVIVDTRFRLTDLAFGIQAYHDGHIPGAVYAHLENDLSGSVIPGKTGRHPLPEWNSFITKLESWGISNASQVIVYDDLGGAIAARCWWMLKYLGHDRVAVLDGGWPDWVQNKFPVEQTFQKRKKAHFKATLRNEMISLLEEIKIENINELVDSRAKERYLGIHEPIDPIAGHIPGAINLPFAENLDDQGHFLPGSAFEKRFKGLSNPTFYCGSGVTACHNILAFELSGMGEAKLYPGSWSEWITHPDNPVAKIP